MEATVRAPVKTTPRTVTAVCHRLRSIEIVGGFLDGETLVFSDGLNCLIGARGAGKTTLLEFVRFALDALPNPQLDHAVGRRVESLVEQNLGGGRVQLEIETKDGLRYRVSRTAGEEPIVLSANGAPTDISLKAGGLFKADIYSQNDVESIADQSRSQLALIDNFEPEQIRRVSSEIAQIEQSLAANASKLIPVRQQITSLTEALAALPEVTEKLKGYAQSAGDENEPVNKAHALKALRDREKRAVEEAQLALTDYRDQFEKMVGWLGSRAASLFPQDVRVGPNALRIDRIASEFAEAGSEIDTLLGEAIRRIDRALREVEETGQALAAGHNEQELEFRKVVEQHEAAQSQSAQRSQLERVRNDLLGKQRQRDELKDRHTALLADREGLAQQLSEQRDRRFQFRQSIVDRINKALEPAIRATLVQSGDPQPYLDKISASLRGGRIKHNVVAQKLVNAFWPADLVAIIQTHNNKRLMDEAELNADQTDRVIAALIDSPALLELESVELIDSPKVELKDGDEYKDSGMLSTGQKCTTILPILLLDSDNPLLVDQPEDNLDNRFIYECVVEKIRKIKTHRQMIFVTHNPNIPVLGDAEQVFVLDSDGVRGRIVKRGDVDACKDEIVTLLEGGEDAFKERRRRYAY